MGRTIPSLTDAIREEQSRLIRVAMKIRDERLRAKLIQGIESSRLLQDAFYDEIADPQEIVLLSIILSMCDCGDRLPSGRNS
ncbi:hypothetical protein HS7_00650 [Sulfolobales archaeon HS-7]|nr:hypothetical protein HS7_00650 [Sulfolobales archaeon HS-7]